MTNESGSSQSSQQEAAAWVRTELESADFGDERLHKRALRILERFWAHPQWSIPTAMGCWAETKATYRFITNPRVTAERILGPHKEATASRMKEHPVVLAVQDTTELNYTSHEALEDIGTIGSSRTLLGMLVHSTIAFTPERLPVGIIDQHTWVRPVEEFGKKASRAQRPIEEKESFKWLLSVTTVEAIQQQLPDVQFVSVGDREADIYELFAYAEGLKTRLLVRASVDRSLENEEDCLWKHMEAQPAAQTLEMVLPVKKSKKVRTATVEVRFAPVTLRPPRAHQGEGKPVDIHAVYVNEPNAPAGVAPLSWMLLTTIPVSDAEGALTVASHYSVRWGIEVFHRILKTGCRIEERQLQSAERIRTCLALDSLVAWRIQFLTILGRETPDLPCDVVFEEYEWKALYCFVHKTTKPPAEPPPLREAVKMLARVGGFLARKRDGQPGPTVLWRGLQELATICFAWFAFGPGRPQS
jgi:hypothetical protein